MTDIAVKIAPKQGADGITDELAEQLHNKTRGSLIAVVEFLVEERAERRDGKESVKLVITHLEPAVEQIGEDHLRDFQRTLFMNRKLHSEDEQLQIDTRDDLEPTVEQVVAANPGLIHHDYMETTTGDCEVCGRPASYALHKDPIDDPFTVKDTPDDDGEQDDSDGTEVSSDEPPA